MRVADYLLEKDRLFARLTLDEQELALYEQVYSRLSLDAPQPDLIVYLQAPVDVLLARIARRGVTYEQGIERRYLERLAEAYSRFFLEYEAAPVLIVNAAQIDLVGSEADYRGLLAEVHRHRKGRHYFNPLKSLF
jgi:deoxyadenosine/deoxycytidine kinase